VTANGRILIIVGRRRRRSGSGCVRCGGLAELGEEFADRAGDGGVSFGLAGPAVFGRVLGGLVSAG
jgi:hypothetical protein